MSSSGAERSKVAEGSRKLAGGVKMESAKDGTSTGGLRPLRGRLTWFNERPRAVFVSNFADVPPPRVTVAGTLTNPILLCCLFVVSTCLLVAWPCDYYRPYGSGGWYNVSQAFSDLSGGLGDPLIRSLPRSFGAKYDTPSGAAKNFFISLISPGSAKLRDCLGNPLFPSDSRPDCKFMALVAFPPLIGIVLVPTLAILAVTGLALVRNGKCYAKRKGKGYDQDDSSGDDDDDDDDEKQFEGAGLRNGQFWRWLYNSDRHCFVRIFGPQRPTWVYPPWLQMLTFLIVLGIATVTSCMLVIGMGSLIHYVESMAVVLDGTNKMQAVPSARPSLMEADLLRLSIINRDAKRAMKRIGNQSVTNATASAAAVQASIAKVKRSVQLVRLAVEGCSSSTSASSCVAQVSAIPNTNLCAIPPGGASYAHGLGVGVVMEGGTSTPTCGPFKVCPCCKACAEITSKLDSVSAAIAGAQELQELRYDALNPENYTQEVIRIGRRVHPLFYSLSNSTAELVSRSRSTSSFIADMRIPLISVNVVVWLVLSAASLCLLFSSLTGSQRVAATTRLMLLIAVILAWPYWGMLGSFAIPIHEMCTQLLPTSSAPSLSNSNLISTLVDETRSVKDILTKCVFNTKPRNLWLDVNGVAKESLAASFRSWDPGSILPPSRVEQILQTSKAVSTMISAYDQLNAEVLGERPELGFNASCKSPTCDENGMATYLRLLRNLTLTARLDGQKAMTDIGKLNIQFSEFLYALRRGSDLELQTRLEVENALWQWADCDVLWNTYEHAHVALCSSAMPSLLSLWASLFVAAVVAILGGLLSDFASRQAMQRQRDSKAKSRSLWAMMGIHHYQTTIDHRRREIAGQMHAKFDTIHGVGEWGVDGWGNGRNHTGGVLPGEKDDPLYPHRSEVFSVILEERLPRASDATGIRRNFPQLDTSQVVPSDQALKEMDHPMYGGSPVPVVNRPLTVKSMADALYEALCVSPHDLLDVVEGRIATLYRGIVAEEDAAKVQRMIEKSRADVYRENKHNVWLGSLPECLKHYPLLMDDQVSSVLGESETGSFLIYRSPSEKWEQDFFGHHSHLVPFCISFKKVGMEFAHHLVWVLSNVDDVVNWGEKYNGWITTTAKPFEFHPSNLEMSRDLFPSIEALVEAMPELRTDLTFLATIPASKRNPEVRGIVRGFINIKAMLDYLESSGVPTSAHDVHRVFRQLGELYKCGDLECKHLEYTPFRAVIMQRVHERRAEGGVSKTGWKTITRATLPRDPASEKHANFSLLSQVTGVGVPETFHVNFMAPRPPSPDTPPADNPEFDFFQSVFNECDQDGDGSLEEDELMILGQKLGLNWTRQGTKDMMLAVDTDGSGTVDMNELWHWVEEVNGKKPRAASYSHIKIPEPEWGTARSVGATVPPGYDQLVLARAKRRAEKSGMLLLDIRASQRGDQSYPSPQTFEEYAV